MMQETESVYILPYHIYKNDLMTQGLKMNSVVQKLLQEKLLHDTVELSSHVSCCQYRIYGAGITL